MRIAFLGLVLSAVTMSLPAVAADALKTPNISANTLFLYQNSNYHKENTDPANVDTNPNGFNVQEAELQIYADVDPYTSLSLLLSIHPNLEANSAGTGVEEKWQLEPEEAFAQSLAIPSTTVKIGKFKAFMGKHNTLHTHAYPFINAPLANTQLLGDEGLNDVGISAAVLLPGDWFNELTLQALRGGGENAEFKSPTPANGVGVAHWKNLLDWNDDLTVEIGASYAQGGNSLAGTTSLAGGDLTFKWRPSVGGRYQSLMWGTEYLSRTRTQAGTADENGGGLASFLQYQFAERWTGLYRYDTNLMRQSFDVAALPNGATERHSLAFAYTPSEFSSFKLEYDRTHGGPLAKSGDTTENAIFLQANFTIGSHPAHNY
jgi:hypothetical protein